MNAETQERRTAVAEILDVDPDRLIHQSFGHGSITFELLDATQPVIIKTSDRIGEFHHTEYHLTQLRAKDIPVPEIVEHRHTEELDILILHKLPGRDLLYELPSMSNQQLGRLAEQIVEIQRKVASFPQGNGFGWTPMLVPGRFKTWIELLERDIRALSAAPGGSDELGQGAQRAAYRAKLRTAIESQRAYLEAVQPTCFLDDLTTKNVIMLNGELQGIVDLDSVCYGDFLYWLALTETVIVLDFGGDRLHYVDCLRKALQLTPNQSRAADLYCAIHGTAFLCTFPDVTDEFADWVNRKVSCL